MKNDHEARENIVFIYFQASSKRCENFREVCAILFQYGIHYRIFYNFYEKI